MLRENARKRSVSARTAVIVVLVAFVIVLVFAGEFYSSGRTGRQQVGVTTTVFISVSCTSTSVTTNGNATTTFVSPFVGNMTVITTVSGFSTNATALCR